MFKKVTNRGVWVAQLVKHPTFDFGSGHDLTVREIEPRISSVLTVWSLLGILTLPLPPLAFSLSLSLSLSLKNK